MYIKFWHRHPGKQPWEDPADAGREPLRSQENRLCWLGSTCKLARFISNCQSVILAVLYHQIMGLVSNNYKGPMVNSVYEQQSINNWSLHCTLHYIYMHTNYITYI